MTDTANTVAEFDRWREETLTQAADVGRRVFALRDVGYTGCGFHWQLERLFGVCLTELSDYDSSKFHEGDAAITERLNAQARWRHLLLRVEVAEKSQQPPATPFDYEAAAEAPEEDAPGFDHVAAAREAHVRRQIDDKIRAALEAAGHKRELVTYSAYKSDAEDCPIDNLDQVAVQGRCVLVAAADDYWGGSRSKPYRSPVLENPTWLQVCVCANAMIRRTRDQHHVFLEGLVKLKKPIKGVPAYRFSMGS